MTDLPESPSAGDFRALARSSPWRFTTLHLTHRQHGPQRQDTGEAVEAWLDRGLGRVTVRTARGVEVSEGVPYSTSAVLTSGRRWWGRRRSRRVEGPRPPRPEPVLRPDGLVAERPEGWHLDHGDPMWRDYQWTAMLDPAELSSGVDVTDVRATTVRGRRTWSATCRPLVGQGEDWAGGYDPRCGCCPLLDSAASRLVEYGPDEPERAGGHLPTVYRVRLDVPTGIVVAVTPLDGTGGSALSNEIHAVDEPLRPPAR